MKTSFKIATLLLVSLLIFSSLGCEKDPPPITSIDNTKGIDNLIKSVGELSDPPVYDTSNVLQNYVEPRDTEIWACTEKHRSVAEAPQEFPIFNPNVDIIWPGAALQGRSIINPTPDRIIAKRGSGKIMINNLTGTFHSSETIPEVSMVNVFEAANKIIADQKQNFPANLAISVEQIHSKAELALSLNANASFFGLFSASASFDFNENDNYSRFLVTLNQGFYSLLFERPTEVNEFFAPTVTADDLHEFVGEGNPPVYISSVNYGRIYYLLIEAVEDAQTIQSSISADFFGIVDAGGTYKRIYQLKDLRIQAFALGGDKDEAINSVISSFQSLQSFLTSLKNGSQIQSAVPLSYVVRSVRSDKLVKNGVATEYTLTDCRPTGDEVCAPIPQTPNESVDADNGCTIDANPVQWNFQWLGCPSATSYNLIVYNPSGTKFLDIETAKNQYPFASTVVQNSSLHGWNWKVRSKTDGIWGPFSSTMNFSVEPINTDCQTGVTLYDAHNYGGASMFLDADNPALDYFNDVTSSVILHNVKGVILYEARDYGGRSLTLTSNTPDIDISPYFFNDVTSSIKILK